MVLKKKERKEKENKKANKIRVIPVKEKIAKSHRHMSYY
jgi:hypothetical protein